MEKHRQLISILTSFITRRPKQTLLLCLLTALPLLLMLPQVKTVKNVDYFTLDNSENIKFHDETKEVFGNDEFFVITIDSEAIFSAEHLKLLAEATNKIEELDNVAEVASLTNVDDTVGSDDYFLIEKLVQEYPNTPEDEVTLKRRALGNKLFRNSLISEDGKTACIFVKPTENLLDENFRERLIKETIEILSPFRAVDVPFRLGGWTVTNLSLSEYMEKDISLFIPLSYLLIAVVVFILFRNPWITLLSILNVTLCVGATMGFFALLDIRLNNVTVIVLPLTMALSLCDTVHIFSHLTGRERDKHPDDVSFLRSVLNQLFLPCLMTSLTTGIGFISLSVSHIPPIQEFSVLSSIGMALEFFYSFFFLPPLILLVGAKRVYRSDANSEGRWSTLLAYLARLVSTRRRLIVGIGCALFIAGAAYSSRIAVETDLLAYFRPTSQIRQDLSYIESRIGGTLTLDVVFEAPTDEDFTNPTLLSTIEKTQNFLISQPEVDHTTSFVDFIKDMNESFHNEDKVFYRIPDSAELIAQYLLLYDSDDIDDVINPERTKSRLVARISSHGSKAQEQLIQRLQAFIDTLPEESSKITITGQVVKQVEVIDELVSGQILSLLLAVMVIAALMIVALRSIRIGLLSLLPNLFPIAMNFGLMGLLGIPLNTGTALVSTVALGIAVDDTIHFLTAYRQKRSAGLNIEESVRGTILEKGTAIISSSIILCIGFGVMTLGSFVPSAYFGLLCAVIMLSALAGDLLFLPALLLLRQSKDQPSASEQSLVKTKG